MKFEEINPYIRYAQCFELKADTAFARVTPCDNRLFYTVSGDAEVTTGDMRFVMKSGSALIIPAGVSYFLTSTSRCTKFMSVNFDYTNNASMIKIPRVPIASESFSNKDIIDKVIFDDVCELNFPLYLETISIESKIKRLISAFSKKMLFYEVSVSGIFKEILADCVRRVKVGYGDDAAIHDILSFIAENLSSPLTNEALAIRFGYNKNYISDLVRRATGAPLHKYILNARIERAIEIIEGGGFLLGEVAEMCGFYDIYHFSKAFKAITGVPPKQYKRTLV